MFSNKKTLLVAGTAAGVAATIIFAALLSSTAASAQMMMPMMQNNNTTNNMMMTMYGQKHQGAHHHNNNMNMFSIMGMSMVKDVAVTGAAVTGDSEITVNVRYTGNATSAPGLGVFVMTNHMNMMSGMTMMMYGGGHQYGMSGGSNQMTMMDSGMIMNGMQQQWNGTMTQDGRASHSGSNFVKAGGWTASGSTIKVKLDGASAYDAGDIMVMVCPYLG
ncbi:MAG: hypothetical protein ABI347_08645 [Nitrososphaera sp.]|jgi:hypothetical protein